MKAINIFLTLVAILYSINVSAQYIELTTQDQVNQLDDIYFAGRLKITTEIGQDSATMITSLEPLARLDSVRQLVIENTILTSLDGLENLSEAHYGLSIYNNPFLEDISAVNGIEQVGRLGQGSPFSIEDNPALIIVPEFENLRLMSNFYFHNNDSLTSIRLNFPLLQTQSNGMVAGVGISDCDNLINFDVRGNVRLGTSSNKRLVSMYVETPITYTDLGIENNPELVEIIGYNSVEEIGQLSLKNNPKLENLCFLKNILVRGDTAIGLITGFNGNAPGANSVEEVLAQDCSNWNSVEDNSWVGGFFLFPNPTSSTLNINFERAQEATVGIYSLTGALLLERQINTQNAQLDVSGLPEGMYVVGVKTELGVESRKIVISK